MSMSITIYPPSISIHAPRTGSDDERGGIAGEVDFNPRSPHGERHTFRCWLLRLGIFQSTLPARGATRAAQHQQKCNLISIHAPRTGSDEHDLSVPCLRRQFQSTLPARGATNHNSRSSYACHISIHAPRTGSDPRDATHLHQHHISIHAPRTGSDSPDESRERNRPISIHAPRTGSDGISRARRCAILPFQSTLPARGATSPVRSQCSDTLFQSTLPARGATFRRFRRVLPLGFQSTLPARGATGSCIELFDAREISIHAPRTGSDDAHRLHRLLDGISIHAPRTGSDPSAKA